MSLLIKALQKAEQEKTADDKNSASGDGLSLELAPAYGTAPEPGLYNEADLSQPTVPPVPSQATSQASQRAAATMFAAKNNPPKTSTFNKSALLGGAALLLLLLLGGGFYFYLNSLNQPELVLPKQLAVTPPPAPAPAVPSNEVADVGDASSSPAAIEELPAHATSASEQSAEKVTRQSSDTAVMKDREESSLAKAEPAIATAPSQRPVRNPAPRSQQLSFGEPITAGENTPVTITRNQPAVGINPDLISAYSAFKSGDDTAAQRYYRQVLKSDVRSTDALLGMAAIAARQGRNNDALGWYGKVLEVEPRNNIAQAGMVSVMDQADPVSSESRIKNLLAQQPEAAYLHAALGALYAGQNQWPLTQQSYFQALHFDAKNAEYAFNLAVALDHMGKTALALQYYKTTLELLSRSGAGNIDRAQVESRIAQLE